MIAVLGAFPRALGRLLRAPGTALLATAALAVLAALAAAFDLQGAWGPLARLGVEIDLVHPERVSVFDDLVHAREAGLGAGTALATLGAIGLFALVDGALVALGSGATKTTRAALGLALRRGPRLLAITLWALAALTAAAFVGRALVVPAWLRVSWAFGVPEALSSLVAEALLLVLLAPAFVAADVARVRVALEDAPAGGRAFLGAFGLSVTRLAPWLALASLVLAEAGLVFAASISRPAWEAGGGGLFLAFAVPLLLVFGRLTVHGAYLGALAQALVPGGRHARNR